MKPFLHERVQVWLQLQGQASELIRRFNAGHPGVAEALPVLLDRAAQSFATHGLSSLEARTLELRAQLCMAASGVDPTSLLRQVGQRRQLLSRITFRVLMALSELLRDTEQHDNAVLAGARQQLAPILLAGMQNGLVAAAGLDLESPSQPAVEAFWRAAWAHVDTGLAARQVALAVGLPDIVVLLCDLLLPLAAVH